MLVRLATQEIVEAGEAGAGGGAGELGAGGGSGVVARGVVTVAEMAVSCSWLPALIADLDN